MNHDNTIKPLINNVTDYLLETVGIPRLVTSNVTFVRKKSVTVEVSNARWLQVGNSKMTLNQII
jgi:hypothetical protein